MDLMKLQKEIFGVIQNIKMNDTKNYFQVVRNMDKENCVSTELIDEMAKVKSDFTILSKDIIENMLKDMSSEEKEVLLRLYIYENK